MDVSTVCTSSEEISVLPTLHHGYLIMTNEGIPVSTWKGNPNYPVLKRSWTGIVEFENSLSPNNLYVHGTYY